MEPDETPKGWLRLRPGTFERGTSVTRGHTQRSVSISGCRVVYWQSDIEEDTSRRNEQISVAIEEIASDDAYWKDEPDKIGAFDLDLDDKTTEMSINSFLPPRAFAQFWSAVDAPYETTQLILVRYKPAPATVHKFPSPNWKPLSHRILAVTEISISQNRPDTSVHPVVAELRTLVEKSRKSINYWLYVAIAIWALVTIFGWFR